MIPDSFFDATIPDTLDITVRLNTNITNEISDARVVALETARTWPTRDGGIMLEADELNRRDICRQRSLMKYIAVMVFGDGELSEDGYAIEWTEIPTAASAQ